MRRAWRMRSVKRLKVLIGCEYSGRVRQAFRDRGHDAWSCDLLPSEDGSPYHMIRDVIEVALEGRTWSDDRMGPACPWDIGIFHPPCTHLAVSGARHFAAKRADGRQQEAIEFFLKLARSTRICRPDQIIQPWQFGHGETKATCLWLKGLPHLVPTNIVPGREPRVHLMPPGPDRWKERSRTYEGIAAAMADQWGDVRQMEIAA